MFVGNWKWVLSSQTKTEVMNDKKDLGKGLICLSDSWVKIEVIEVSLNPTN